MADLEELGRLDQRVPDQAVQQHDLPVLGRQMLQRRIEVELRREPVGGDLQCQLAQVLVVLDQRLLD